VHSEPLTEVVFHSMAMSSAEDVPCSLEFLFSQNRLNVAVARAMCLAHVVATSLLESRARTIEQMRLINALYRFVEMAEAQTRGRGVPAARAVRPLELMLPRWPTWHRAVPHASEKTLRVAGRGLG
jgi:hypothetical protein